MALALNFAHPAMGDVISTALAGIRDNTAWLMAVAASASYMLPGFTTTVSGAGPTFDYIEMLHNGSSMKMKWSYTWSNGVPNTITWQFDDGLGGGYKTLDDGVITLTYDADGYLLSAASTD